MSKPPTPNSTEALRVLDYTPRKFDLGVPKPAFDFQEIQRVRENDFHMSDVLRIQTGLNKIAAQKTELEVEERTLNKLKEIQESAYQEAYALGLEEGKKEAFTKAETEIEKNLAEFGGLITKLETIKSEMLKQNESHLLKLALHIANRLAHHEVQVNNECVVDIMRKAIESAQIEEEITVQVSSLQFEFLESLKKETGRQFEFLKKAKLVPIEGMTPGSCVIETNYGVIDARFEERMTTLWETAAENLHRVKDKIGAA